MEQTLCDLNRLRCACTFTESARRLEQLLDKTEFSNDKNHQASIKDMKAVLQGLQAEYKEHVERHNIEYAHSFMEFYKGSTVLGGGPVLKTSALTSGDLKRARNPVKKLSKKEGKKRQKSKKIKEEV